WSMADHLRAGLCVDALVMALQRRRPEPGLVHHSDRGGRYAAEPYRHVLARHGIKQSMSRRGNCLDNAPMESFFASLKKEHVHHVRFRSRAEARAAVFEYVEIFYNRRRLHSGLGYRTPAEARADMEAIVMPAAACHSDLTPPLSGSRSTLTRRTGADGAVRIIDDATEGLMERHAAETVRVVGRVRLVGTFQAAVGSRPIVAGFGRTACRAPARPAG